MGTDSTFIAGAAGASVVPAAFTPNPSSWMALPTSRSSSSRRRTTAAGRRRSTKRAPRSRRPSASPSPSWKTCRRTRRRSVRRRSFHRPRGYNIIIGSAFGYSDTFKELAEQVSEGRLHQSGGNHQRRQPPVVLRHGPTSRQYLCGMAAGAMSKSGKLGFVARQSVRSRQLDGQRL